MNNTKWNEIFKTFYALECTADTSPLIRWRTKDKENGYISNWDGTWSHFGCEPRDWDRIDYLQIKLTEENREFVLIELRRIHVPGEIADDIVTVYGYRTDVDYL